MTYYGAVAIVEASGVTVPTNLSQEQHTEIVRAALRILDDVEFKAQRQRLIDKGVLLGAIGATLYSQLMIGAATVTRSMSPAAKAELRKRVTI